MSGVRVSVSFQSFALSMFVCPIMFFAVPSAVPCARKVIFQSRSSCHVLGIPQNDAVVLLCRCAPLRVLYKPVDGSTFSTATMGLGGAASCPDPSSMYQI